MNLTSICPCCKSGSVETRLGYFQPFISHRVMGYPFSQINVNGGVFYPLLFTNSLRCQQCSFVFSQVRFDDDEMTKIYSGYRGDDYTATRELFEPGYAELNKYLGKHPQEVQIRADTFFNFICTRVTPQDMNSVLDYGGDRGQHIPDYFSNATKYVYDVSGVEPMEGVTDINKASNAIVDFIICSNVLEHIPYPSDTLNDIIHCMHPGTLLFIDVPDEIAAAGEYPLSFHEHINYFTETSLQQLMKKNGFKVLKTKTVEMDFGYTKARQIFLLAKLA